MILSILICSLESRYESLEKLVNFLKLQPGFATDFNIYVQMDNGEISVGKKRQQLLEQADGDYVVFIDDDDEVTDDYIFSILEACKRRPDVVGISGWMTTNGGKKEYWSISMYHPYETIKNHWTGKVMIHLRFNNHISPVKRSIALKVGFNDMRYAEDYDFAVRLKNSGLVKTEVAVMRNIYHYKYKTKK